MERVSGMGRIVVSCGQILITGPCEPVRTTFSALLEAASQDNEDVASLYREMYLDAEAILEGCIR